MAWGGGDGGGGGEGENVFSEVGGSERRGWGI